MNQGRISMARLRSAINRSRPPDSLLVDYGSLPGPTLGTIHGSKGRESDLVHLMLPSDYRLDKTDGRGILEEMRILFVGASRAREFLGVGKGYSINSKRLHGSGRAYKTRRDSYQVEFGLMACGTREPSGQQFYLRSNFQNAERPLGTPQQILYLPHMIGIAKKLFFAAPTRTCCWVNYHSARLMTYGS